MLKTAKVVGLNSDTDAALAQVFSSDGLNLFIITSCSFEDAFTKTRQVLFDAQEIFSATEGSISEKLSKTLSFIQQALSEAENLQVLVAVVCEDEAGSVFYLQSIGQDLVTYLLRGGSRNDLGSMSEGTLVSGMLKPGDRVVMATKSLVELLDGDSGSLSRFPIESLEDEVAAHLPEADPYPVAAIVTEEEAVIEPETENIIIEEKVASSFENRTNFKETAGQLGKSLVRRLPRSRKGVAILIIVIAVLVGAGLFFNAQSKKDSEISANFEGRLKIASEEYSKAQSLKDSDSQAALASLTLAKSAVDDALKIKPQDGRALDLKRQIEEGSGGVMKVYQIGDFPLWLDLDLIKKGLTAKKLSFSLGNILILDETAATLVEVGITNKSQQTLAGQEKLGEAKLASLNGEIAWVYSEDKGMVRVDTKSKEVKVGIKSDDEWGRVVEIFGFAGNVYLLDSDKNQIWKYVPVVSGYSDKQSYFKEEVKANLSDVKKFQIDSSVWVLRGGGEILKFTQGSTDFFSLQGLDKPVRDPKSFYVSDTTDNLYLLDSGNNRLLVIDKKGVYKAQYQSDKLGTFSDLVVDETGKKVYLLDGSKIYVMELK